MGIQQEGNGDTMGTKGKKLRPIHRRVKIGKNRVVEPLIRVYTPLIGPVYRLSTQKFFTTHIPIIGDSSIFAPDLQKQRRNMAYVTIVGADVVLLEKQLFV